MNQCDEPQQPLISYDDALERLLALVAVVDGVDNKSLLDCLGDVLAESITSTINVPPADNSAMDGYAICTEDINTQGDTVLPVSQRIVAGEQGVALKPGSAARIFTGAPIPAGADAVIMQEQVERIGEQMRFSVKPASGQNIRLLGNDIRSGDTVLDKGALIRAQELGLAASVGLDSLKVHKKLRVGIFFTGDELVEPGQKLAAGKIYDSNRYTLHGFLQTLGCEIIDLGLVGDTLQATKTAMLEASERADLVITSGGVSVGEEDHVRIAIEQLGELNLWRLRVKPGKPMAFGHINGTPFLGLPGNPVSVFANFLLFGGPLIKTMQGRTWKKPQPVPVIAGFDWLKPDSRREFLRARLDYNNRGELVANIFPKQDSAVLTSTSWAQGLVEIGEGQTLKSGERVGYLSFSELLN